MIESIRLKNYRGHADTTIPCGRLTVLVGENAAGKTSVLRAVDSISRGIEASLPAELIRAGATSLEVQLTGHGPRPQFEEQSGEVRAGSGADVAWQIVAEYELSSDKSSLQAKKRLVLDLDGEVTNRPNATFLSLDAEALARPSSSSSVVPKLAPSGAGLASVLAYLKLAEMDRFVRITARLREVVPIVTGLGYARVEVKETVARLMRIDDREVEVPQTVTTFRDQFLVNFLDAEGVPASLVSEGTLVTLGILTALEVFHRERAPIISRGVVESPVDVMLVDDLDRALHPRAQRKLVETLRAALDAIPNLQILATTHSPYLLDALRSDEVVILGRDPQNQIAARRLDSFPDGRLQQMLATGELWMSEGEDWIKR